MLAVENISWGPSREQLLVRNVSFEAPAGSVTVVVGPNGAGKSSLLRCIYRYNAPLSGRVRLSGKDMAQLPSRMVAQSIAVVLQEQASDFPLTVREVVELGRTPYIGMFGADPAGTSVVMRALERMSLQPFIESPFQRLSGGEKQRVAIARALCQEPQLLVLDEPTNHLDIRHQLELLSLLRSLGLTIVMSLHDISMAANVADQVVLLSEGNFIAAGPPLEVLTPRQIRQTFGVEAKVVNETGLAGGSGAVQFSFRLPEQAMEEVSHA